MLALWEALLAGPALYAGISCDSSGHGAVHQPMAKAVIRPEPTANGSNLNYTSHSKFLAPESAMAEQEAVDIDPFFGFLPY